MARPFDRRTFLTGAAAAAAAAAGASALGVDPAGAVYTNGPGRNGISKAKPKRGGTIVFGTDAEEQGFDPTSARYDEVGFLYARTVFDPVAIVTATGAWEPFLAQSITPNADYTAWTVTLRPNLVFHDGTPCNGAALLLNAERQIASALTGPAIKSFVSNVTQTGPLSIRFDLTSPWVSFPYGLADSQLSFVAAPSMLRSGDTSHPVGTGPFVFGEWVPQSHFTSHRNPHYWRKNLPYLDSITFKPIIDAEGRASALQSGSIDIMVTNTPRNQETFRGDRQYSYVDDTGKLVGEPDINMIQLNCTVAPTSNRTVREALATATNRAKFAQEIGLGIGAPVNGVFTPGTPYYSKTPYPSYNLAKAKNLVKQAEQELKGPVAFTLQLIPDPDIQRAAQFLQSEWQAAGMQVTLSTVLQGDLIDNALKGDYQAVTWRQFGAVSPDLNYVWWSTETATLHAPYSINMARNVDPRIQRALLAARSSPSNHESVAQYQKVNQLLGQDIPYVFLNRSPWAIVSSPHVQNWNNPTTPQGTPALGMHLGVVWPQQIWVS